MNGCFLPGEGLDGQYLTMPNGRGGENPPSLTTILLSDLPYLESRLAYSQHWLTLGGSDNTSVIHAALHFLHLLPAVDPIPITFARSVATRISWPSVSQPLWPPQGRNLICKLLSICISNLQLTYNLCGCLQFTVQVLNYRFVLTD